jgi:hypothetical protein
MFIAGPTAQRIESAESSNCDNVTKAHSVAAEGLKHLVDE